jgi:O-glycosyl hydrolase
MRRVLLTVATFATVVGIAGASATETPKASVGASEVKVDLAANRQTIQGFGSSNRVWMDPHVADGQVFVPATAQAKILAALYGRLGLTRVRNVLDQGVQKTPGGRFESEGKLADAHIAFVKQAKRYGLKTFFPGPVYVEPWIGSDDVRAYVDWAMAMLQRWRAQGLEPPLYAPQNEPRINGDFPPRWLHDVVVQLGSRLRSAGLRTKLVIPDDENPADAYRRAVAVLEDPNARQYVGAVAYHVYRWDWRQSTADIVRLRQLAGRYKLPLWMTEYSSSDYRDWASSLEWAERMHVLLTDGGVGAIDYMWGYFGSWSGGASLLSLNFSRDAYLGYTPTPRYWMMGQYSRFVRPGFRRVAATPSVDGVLVSAFKSPERAIIVATNPSGSTKSIRVTVRGGKVTGLVRPIRSSEEERWKSLPPIRLRGASFVVVLPPASMTTYTASR